MNYTAVRETAKNMGDRGACSMIAISLTTNIPYDQVRARCVEAGLWDDKRGGWVRGSFRYENTWHRMIKLFPEIDLDGMVVAPRRGRTRVSFQTVGRMFHKGTYIIECRGHVAALIDGKVEDWSEGRRKVCLAVYPVTPRVSGKRGTLTLRGVV